MNTLSIVLASLLTLTMVVLMAPNILALNRGRALRNIALWLAIALGLALIYQSVGPGAKIATTTPMGAEQDEMSAPMAEDNVPNDSGFTPPGE